MSKERARRRAERVALAERTRARRAAAERRRAGRRALARRFRSYLPGRTGRLMPRRSRVQRRAILGLTVLALGLVWSTVDSLALRIALSLVLVLALPAFVVIALDRRI